MSTWYATNNGVDPWDGTSLGSAAICDAGSNNTVWTKDIVAGDTIKICGNCVTNETIANQDDGSATEPITVQGRDIDDTMDTQVLITAGGLKNFPIFTCAGSDYWVWKNITAFETDKLTPNHGWLMGATAQSNLWIDCKAIDCYNGWDFGTNSAYYHRLRNCLAQDCKDHGFWCSGFDALEGCIARGCEGIGFNNALTCKNCIADTCTGLGFVSISGLLDGCVAYGGSTHGFSTGSKPALWINCISSENGAKAFQATAHWAYLLNFFHYDNSTGLSNGELYDGTPIELLGSASGGVGPFVDAANGDFRLNNAATGGGLCRQLARVSADGLWTGYPDAGAVESRIRREALRTVALRPWEMRP